MKQAGCATDTGPSIGRTLSPADMIELIDHLKGTGPSRRRYPAQWFGTLRHLRRREIRDLLSRPGGAF